MDGEPGGGKECYKSDGGNHRPETLCAARRLRNCRRRLDILARHEHGAKDCALGDCAAKTRDPKDYLSVLLGHVVQSYSRLGSLCSSVCEWPSQFRAMRRPCRSINRPSDSRRRMSADCSREESEFGPALQFSSVRQSAPEFFARPRALPTSYPGLFHFLPSG